jgi:Mg2+-importing ATPase
LSSGARRQPGGSTDAAAVDGLAAWWSIDAAALCKRLETSRDGLPGAVAAERLARLGPNVLGGDPRVEGLALLGRQVANPLVLVLVAAALVALAVGDWTDATIILLIVLGSSLLGFVQEYRAGWAVAGLRARLALRTTVLRDGHRGSCRVPRSCRGT